MLLPLEFAHDNDDLNVFVALRKELSDLPNSPTRCG